MTSHQPENPHFAEPDIPDTEVISVAAPAPVFVDSSGRRSRFLRRLAYGFGALVVLYGGLISVSLAGGPVRSSAVLPLPGLETGDDVRERMPARPVPVPTPAPSQKPAPVLVTEALPRRAAGTPRAAAPRLEATRITLPVPSPSRSAKPAAEATRPVESTTTTPATTTPTTTPTSTPVGQPLPATTPPVAPPPQPDTGGAGGGVPVDSPDSGDSGSGSGTSAPPADAPATEPTTEAGTATGTTAGPSAEVAA